MNQSNDGTSHLDDLQIECDVSDVAECLYRSDRCQVWHGDAISIARHVIGPRGCDVVICDPPYTEHVHRNIRSVWNGKGKNGKPLKVRAWEPGFEALGSFAHVPVLIACASRWTLCFCALESFGDYVDAAGGHWKAGGNYVRSGIWRKQHAAPQLSGDRPANSCEGIAVMHARLEGARMHWNGRGKHAFWRAEMEQDPVTGLWLPADELSVEHGRERAQKRHPTQKPRKLMLELVELFSNEDEWIADLYAGSGATGEAGLALSRRVILADNDRQWAEYCAARMAEIEGQSLGKAA